jgi:hypothetical protein
MVHDDLPVISSEGLPDLPQESLRVNTGSQTDVDRLQSLQEQVSAMALHFRSSFSAMNHQLTTFESFLQGIRPHFDLSVQSVRPREFTKVAILEHEDVKLTVTLKVTTLPIPPRYDIRTAGIANLSAGAEDLEVAFDMVRTALHALHAEQPKLPLFPAHETARHFFSLDDVSEI